MKFPSVVPVLGFLLLAAAALGDVLKTGERLTLFATSDGNPPPVFEWFRGTTKIAEGQTLTIESVTPGDAGAYTVKATNSEGESTSPPFGIEIVDVAPVVIASNPVDSTVKEGAPLKLFVIATGRPTPSYQWRKDGTPIPGATSSTLAFAAISRTDAGSYSVAVSNSSGTVTSTTARVVVLYPPSGPTITRGLANATIRRGESHLFEVTAAGEAPLKFLWRHDGYQIAGVTGAKLAIVNAKPKDAGGYSVRVSNARGEFVESGAALAVTTGGKQ